MKAFIFLLVFSASLFAQPYEPHVIWDRSGETDSSAYGYKILPLGDQNDDGYADWAVFAWGNGGGWHGTRASYIEFFHGGPSPSIEPYYAYRVDTSVYDRRFWLEEIGDVNGDGYQDWLIIKWTVTVPVTYVGELFYGGDDMNPDLNFLPTEGYLEGTIGDFNSDGYSDLYTYDFGTDALRIYYGSNSIDIAADWTLFMPPPGQIQSIPYAIGDFNGDGASDFICYNPNPPYDMAIFLGGVNPDTLPDYIWSDMMWPIGGVKSLNGDTADEFLLGLGVHYGRDSLSPIPDAILNSGCGNQAMSAGDFNHDGYNDLILLTPTTPDNMFGCLDLHLGHPWLYPNPAFSIEGDWPDGLIGIWTAAGLGDVNGDSIDDIAVGAWDDFAYLGWRGRCVILSGDDTLIASADNSQPEIAQTLEIEAYPNPFNSETTLRLLAPPSHAQTALAVYNVLGQEVLFEQLPPFSGEYVYHLDAHEWATGLYLVYVRAGNLHTTQKLMLLS